MSFDESSGNDGPERDPVIAGKFVLLEQLEAPDLWDRIEADADLAANDASLGGAPWIRRGIIAAAAAIVLISGGVWISSTRNQPDVAITTGVADSPSGGNGAASPSAGAAATPTPDSSARPPVRVSDERGNSVYVGDNFVPALRRLGFLLSDREAECLTAEAPTDPPENLAATLRPLVDHCLGPDGTVRLVDAMFGARLSYLAGVEALPPADYECLLDNLDFGGDRSYAVSVCGLFGRLLSRGNLGPLSPDTIACIDRETKANPFSDSDGPYAAEGDPNDPILAALKACGTSEEVEMWTASESHAPPPSQLGDPKGLVGEALVPTMENHGFKLADSEASCLDAEAPTAPPAQPKNALRRLVDGCLGADGPLLLVNAMFGMDVRSLAIPDSLTEIEVDCLLENVEFAGGQWTAISACGLFGRTFLGEIPHIRRDTMICVDREAMLNPLLDVNQGFEDEELLPYLEACATAEEIDFFLYGS